MAFSTKDMRTYFPQSVFTPKRCGQYITVTKHIQSPILVIQHSLTIQMKSSGTKEFLSGHFLYKL